MFTTGSYQGAPRVAALTWGAEDLADAVGASGNREPDGSYGFTYELARSLCLLGAAAAGVTPIEPSIPTSATWTGCAAGPSRSAATATGACWPSIPTRST